MYWLEGYLLMIKDNMLFAPIGGLHKELLWETHYTKQEDYPKEERILEQLTEFYYQPIMGEYV